MSGAQCDRNGPVALLQVIVDDYVKSEAVLKESRMHHELDLDGVLSTLHPSCCAWHV